MKLSPDRLDQLLHMMGCALWHPHDEFRLYTHRVYDGDDEADDIDMDDPETWPFGETFVGVTDDGYPIFLYPVGQFLNWKDATAIAVLDMHKRSPDYDLLHIIATHFGLTEMKTPLNHLVYYLP